ncbi:MAG: DUF1844 domain-containing protein [Acidobacteriota bacterium]
MSKEKEQESSRFKVDDRRMFTPEGEPVGRGADEPKDRNPRSPATEPDRPVGQERAAERPNQGDETVDFASFVLSLATSAMAYLGEVPDPASGKMVENLEGAKQMIDILSMLQEKTKGNLEKDEDRLISSLLYELRMKYLGKARVIKL